MHDDDSSRGPVGSVAHIDFNGASVRPLAFDHDKDIYAKNR